MFLEKFNMVLVLVKSLRSQNTRENWNTRIKLNSHNTVNNCVSNKFVAIDATINNKSKSNDT